MKRRQSGAEKRKKEDAQLQRGQTKVSKYFKSARDSTVEDEEDDVIYVTTSSPAPTAPASGCSDEPATVCEENDGGDADGQPTNHQTSAQTAPVQLPAMPPPSEGDLGSASESSKSISTLTSTSDNSLRQQATTSPSEDNMSKLSPETQMKQIKTEEPMVKHDEHTIRFKYASKYGEYRVTCLHPCTVLQALQKIDASVSDVGLVIKRHNRDLIATHFPCHLIQNEELLTIKQLDKPTIVGKSTTENLNQPIYPKEMYVTFSINRQGGKNNKSKILLRDKRLSKFCRHLGIYGLRGESIECALQRDGRFLPIVTEPGSYLRHADIETDIRSMMYTEVNSLENGKFEIGLKIQQKKDDIKTGTSFNQTKTSETEVRSSSVDNQKSTAKQASQRNEPQKVYKYTPLTDNEEVLQILRNQFDDLKKKMESREERRENGKKFPEVLQSLKNENFGKLKQTFSEVHRVRKLMELANSVCRVDVGGSPCGTGFVLFDNFILTNAHLFKESTVRTGQQLSVDVSVRFEEGSHVVKAKSRLIDYQIDPDEKQALDYAILELDLDTVNLTEKLPQGLLCRIGPAPDIGEACLIGHPDGGLKQMDPTCIIERKNREWAVEQHRAEFMIFTLNEKPINSDIMNFIKGKTRVVSYNTFFYYGASGSPIFDCFGRVFGLHTGGFPYLHEGTKRIHSVVEFAHPLVDIMMSFMRRLAKDGRGDSQDILRRVEEELGKSPYKQLFFPPKPSDGDPEPMEE